MKRLFLLRYDEQRYFGRTADVNGYMYKYPRPMVTVDAVIFAGTGKDRCIALIRRRHDPFADCWALPGGFVDMDEPLEAAAARELREETGLEGIGLTQFHTFGDPGRDPRGRSISVAYYGFLPAPAPLRAADDAADARWFPEEDLPPLAFDHDRIVALAQQAVQGQGR